jgi:hypothetical protein
MAAASLIIFLSRYHDFHMARTVKLSIYGPAKDEPGDLLRQKRIYKKDDMWEYRRLSIGLLIPTPRDSHSLDIPVCSFSPAVPFPPLPAPPHIILPYVRQRHHRVKILPDIIRQYPGKVL